MAFHLAQITRKATRCMRVWSNLLCALVFPE